MHIFELRVEKYELSDGRAELLELPTQLYADTQASSPCLTVTFQSGPRGSRSSAQASPALWVSVPQHPQGVPWSIATPAPLDADR